MIRKETRCWHPVFCIWIGGNCSGCDVVSQFNCTREQSYFVFWFLLFFGHVCDIDKLIAVANVFHDLDLLSLLRLYSPLRLVPAVMIVDIYEIEAIKIAVCNWINDFCIRFLCKSLSAACLTTPSLNLICFYANLEQHSRCCDNLISRRNLYLMEMSIAI